MFPNDQIEIFKLVMNKIINKQIKDQNNFNYDN